MPMTGLAGVIRATPIPHHRRNQPKARARMARAAKHRHVRVNLHQHGPQPGTGSHALCSRPHAFRGPKET